MAAALALRRIKTDSSFLVIEKILLSKTDYRVRINTIRALQAFPFDKTKNYLLKAVNDPNTNIGIAASEVILASITSDAWIELANVAPEIKNWRIQANLYQAILKVSENKSVVSEVKEIYQRSADPYQKAALLSALQQSFSSLDFIEQAFAKADTAILRTTAVSALVELNKNKNFKPSLSKRFAESYQKAMSSGDPAVIGTIAGALADSSLGYRNIINDFSFLYEAKKKLSLPKDNEALQPLEAAIAHFEKRKLAAEVKNEFNHPIDWTLVKTIPSDQRAIIKTSKGTIIIRLLVEEAPGSVANFISLAQKDYFDQKFFHRVVPNFVIQGGCKRGDGSGSEDYSIRSEFSQRRYTTGSVGMASAGKDTEGTQWFITHSPTPHLDGRYTIFAEVESGMEVVHRIEVGDQILDVEIKIPGPAAK
jgi:cyclophilin family peptidyl-prolyl cis-trans isomerase